MKRTDSSFIRRSLLALASLALALPSVALAEEYDLAEDFSATNNPAGAWSYGWTDTLGGTFTLSTLPGTRAGGNVDTWDDPNIFAPQMHNRSGSSQTIFSHVPLAAGQAMAHPGPDDQHSLFRWTAPLSGDITITAAFDHLDPIATVPGPTEDVYVLHNGTALFSDVISEADLVASTSGLTIFVEAGDTVDFAVGNGAEMSYFDDAVGVSGTIVYALRADAGSDQTVEIGDVVELDGSASTGPDDFTYSWVQLGGTPVALDDPTVAIPTFVAPWVPLFGETLSFELTVTAGSESDASLVHVTVSHDNTAPVADATAASPVAEGALVALDGSASFDADGHALTYGWTQVSGMNTVVLDDPTAEVATFTAPSVGPSGDVLGFELVVNDGTEDSEIAFVEVEVSNVNTAPSADAGMAQTVSEGSSVTLSVGGSDADGDALSLLTEQVAGPSVTLDDAASANPSFTAPFVGPGGTTLEFEVSVSDGELSDLDTVVITVQNAGDPPACELAMPLSPKGARSARSARSATSALWPPKHKLRKVAIGNLIGASDEVNVLITGVTSDEPVSGLGGGDTSPDAVLKDDVVLLRAERDKHGNGRVYVVSFTATIPSGESCDGSVSVCVPRKKGRDCIDDGQFYVAD